MHTRLVELQLEQPKIGFYHLKSFVYLYVILAGVYLGGFLGFQKAQNFDLQ